MTAQKIRTFLWYDDKAEEATRFYVSLFDHSQIDDISRGPDGSAFVVSFTLAGISYIALNGGPMYRFSEAISLSVECKDQTEIDFLWEKLISEGGEPSRCGWLKDRFGLSWQIVPACLSELLSNPDKGPRTMNALMSMNKIDIESLRSA